MFRAVAIIAAAIGLANPTISAKTRTSYARLIRAASGCATTRCEIDPFTVVALYWHESNFNPRAVGDSGRAIGLGQSWTWLYSSACRNDADPVKRPSAACKAKRDALFNPAVAIKTTTNHIRTARKLCRKRTRRSALFHRWLSLLAGRNHPRRAFRGVWCAQTRVTIGRRTRWRDLAWRTDPRFRAVREIVDCRHSLILKRRCHREGRTGGGRSRSTRRR